MECCTDQSVTFTHHEQPVDLWLPDQNNLDWIREHGDFCEHEMLRYIEQLDIGGTYIDVGACFGNHAVHFARFTQAERVVAIEPCLTSFQVMMRNLVVNLCLDVLPIYGAAGERRTWCGIAAGQSDRLPHRVTVTGSDVPVFRLSQLDTGRVGLIKIDVEGGELSVLRGAEALLLRDHPHLFVEAKDDQAHSLLKEYLRTFGYKERDKFNYIPTYHFSYDRPRR